MDRTLLLKAIADERKKILSLLLRHNYCVRTLARKLELSEGSIAAFEGSAEAGLLSGEKRAISCTMM